MFWNVIYCFYSVTSNTERRFSEMQEAEIAKQKEVGSGTIKSDEVQRAYEDKSG